MEIGLVNSLECKSCKNIFKIEKNLLYRKTCQF